MRLTYIRSSRNCVASGDAWGACQDSIEAQRQPPPPPASPDPCCDPELRVIPPALPARFFGRFRCRVRVPSPRAENHPPRAGKDQRLSSTDNVVDCPLLSAPMRRWHRTPTRSTAWPAGYACTPPAPQYARCSSQPPRRLVSDARIDRFGCADRGGAPNRHLRLLITGCRSDLADPDLIVAVRCKTRLTANQSGKPAEAT